MAKQKINYHDEASVGLVDAILTMANLLRNSGRDLSHPQIQEAFLDIRDSDDMKWLMNMGELEDCRVYIKKLEDRNLDLLKTLKSLMKKLPKKSVKK